VTEDRFLARCFAFGYPRGDLYQVDPFGELDPDPEHERSFAATRARVRLVLDRGVVLRPAEVSRMMNEAGLTFSERVLASMGAAVRL
ncbi:MAG: hypothetical protein ACRDH9_09235, partial [Actinomycetota bacterium]